MSERGTFMTDFIYCQQCLESAKQVLGKVLADPCLTVITKGKLSALYGTVSGLYAGEEIDVIEDEVIPELEKVLCHPLRFVVLAESMKEPKAFHLRGKK
jgi:hypothetical protein